MSGHRIAKSSVGTPQLIGLSVDDSLLLDKLPLLGYQDAEHSLVAPSLSSLLLFHCSSLPSSSHPFPSLSFSPPQPPPFLSFLLLPALNSWPLLFFGCTHSIGDLHLSHGFKLCLYIRTPKFLSLAQISLPNSRLICSTLYLVSTLDVKQASQPQYVQSWAPALHSPRLAPLTHSSISVYDVSPIPGSWAKILTVISFPH